MSARDGSTDMTSGPRVRSTIPTATMVTEPPRLKLRSGMRPRRPTAGYVDGAWWPRSRDPSTELPALLAVLAARLGPIARMTYHPKAWDPSARHVNADGTLVRLGEHGLRDPDTVDVTTSSGHHLTLIVVSLPVGTESDTARSHRAMLAPSRGGGTEQPMDELLSPTTAGATSSPHHAPPTGAQRGTSLRKTAIPTRLGLSTRPERGPMTSVDPAREQEAVTETVALRHPVPHELAVRP